MGEFMEAGVGSRPFYAWRSIIFGREILAKGLVKCVNNGRSLKVWLDSWINDRGSRRPLMKNPIIDIMMTMNQLINVAIRN